MVELITDWITALATSIGAIIAVVAIIFVVKQLKQIERSTRGTTHQSILESVLSLDRLFVEDPELAKLWGDANPQYYNPKLKLDELRRRWVIIMIFDYFRNIMFQTEQKNIPPEILADWEWTIKNEFLKSKEVIENWKILKKSYAEDFRQHIDKLISNN